MKADFIWIKRCFVLLALSAGMWSQSDGQRVSATVAESRAIAFLIREVPAWSKNNGCYSCHNNGDAARALYRAMQKGCSIPTEALTDTTNWAGQPAGWEQNKGDPGFSDKRLASIQFAATLLAAMEAGQISDRRPLAVAARKLANDQDADGAWKIEAANTPGSPTTYGAQLATWMALRVLKKAALPETLSAVQKAERWLAQSSSGNISGTATLLLAGAGTTAEAARAKQDQYLRILRNAQTRDGGWGPYADAPPEPFDTALALLALATVRREPGVEEMIQRGRNFLAAQQNADGSWPATTRPPGYDSYAQMMSTTGWATLALLETRE